MAARIHIGGTLRGGNAARAKSRRNSLLCLTAAKSAVKSARTMSLRRKE